MKRMTVLLMLMVLTVGASAATTGKVQAAKVVSLGSATASAFFGDGANVTNVTGLNIQAGTVDSNAIGNGEVTTAKLAASAVQTAKMADDAVTAAAIINAAVQSAKLADDAVTTAKMINAAVQTAKLADDSVTSVAIVNAAVQTAKLAADAVTNSAIANATIQSAKVAYVVNSDVNTNKAGYFVVTDAGGKLPKLDGSQLTGLIPTLPMLTNDYIWVGNTSNAATAVQVHGDATLLTDGTLTVGMNAITSPKIAAGAVGSDKIGAGQVMTANIANAAVDTTKLNTDAVDSTKILNAAVQTSKLAADAVTNSSILNATIGTGKLAVDAVTSSDILSVAGAKVTGNISGNAGTATALAAAGTAAPTNYVCRGVDASGNCLTAHVETNAEGVNASTEPWSAGAAYAAIHSITAVHHGNLSGNNGTMGVGDTVNFNYPPMSVNVSSITVVITSEGEGGSGTTTWSCCNGTPTCLSVTTAAGAARNTTASATGMLAVSMGDSIKIAMTASGELITPSATVTCGY